MESREYVSVEELLKTQDEVMTLTRGISMRPLLRQHRDIVVIKKPVFPLKKGDVPLYKVKGRKELTLHRILKVTKDGYVIRGDNLFRKEYDVKDGDIVGVMTAFYREGKYYTCEDKRYKLYVFLNRISYPLRYLWRIIIKPYLVKIKHLLIKP